MDVLLVTVPCVVAVAVALELVWRHRAIELAPKPWPGPDAPPRDILANYVRSLAIGAAAGELAGLLVGGFGSRLMMRIIAATSGSSAQGLFTEAEERVGEINFDGTLALAAYIPLLFLLVPPFVVIAVLGALGAVAVHAVDAIGRTWRRRAVDRVGQAALALAGAVFVVPFVAAVTDIIR